MRHLLVLGSALALVCVASILQAADDPLVLVINKNNPVDNVTKAQLRKMILGEQGSWPGGKKVAVILRPPGQADRVAVLRSICDMDDTQFNEHLMKSNFSGEASAPKIAANLAGLRQLVVINPGAVAFLHISELSDLVKAITLDGVAPGKPEYAIKAAK